MGAFVVVEAAYLLTAASFGWFAVTDGAPLAWLLGLAVAAPTLVAAGLAMLITRLRGNGPRIDLRMNWSWRAVAFGLATLPVMKVRDAQVAIDKANDSPYGLSGSIWTRDKAKGMALAKQMATGSVNINNAMLNGFQYPVPFAGWKQSGVGSRSGGANGIRKYCRAKTIVADRVAMKRELFWYPYTPRRGKVQSLVARLLGARDWRRRLGRSHVDRESGNDRRVASPGGPRP